MCDMCDAANIEHQDDTFKSLPSCNTHPAQPLVILKQHKSMLTPGQSTHYSFFIKKFYPGHRSRNTGMVTNTHHWHEHLIKKDFLLCL